MQKRSIAVAIVTGSAVVASALTGTGTASAGPAPKAIAHSKPAWTAHAKHLGHANNAGLINTRVYLAPKHGLDAVKAFATAASTRGSASYHHFLTTKQYQQRFGTTDATVAAVSAYLKSAGLKVGRVGASNRYLTVTGRISAAEKAFGAQMDTYRHNGRTVRAPASTLTLPSSVRSKVLTVTGLDTSVHRVTPASAAPPAGFRNARPCSRYYGQVAATVQGDFKTPLPKFQGKTLAYAPCGYTGPQFRAAYEGDTELDGSGVTVGIVDAYSAPTIHSDANRYAESHGDGSYLPGQLKLTRPAKFSLGGPKQCDASGWYGEETLDVEAVHAMAPAAGIHFYAAASCNDSDFTDAIQRVVDQDDVQIVTNSYGEPEEAQTADQVMADEAVFLQGATEGISFVFSSGDSGDEVANTAIKQADASASDPYVTAVGGTSTGIGADGALSFQAGWGTNKYSLSADGKSWAPVGFLYGAGGGTSALFNQPSYQAGVTHGGGRQVPDVAMDADPNTGMLIGETQTFAKHTYYDEYRLGGTSLASPLFAGMTALSIQSAGGVGGGLLNPTIYGNTSNFTDVVPTGSPAGDVRADYKNGVDASDGVLYSVRTFGTDSSLKVTKGYDQVTGIGVPNSGWLSALG